MSRRLRKALKILGIVLFGLVVLGVGSMHYMSWVFSDDGTMEKLSQKNIPYTISAIPFGEYKIGTVRVGDPDKPKALLIHGSPGHWYDWEYIITDEDLLSKYCLISYDRPGYGLTTMPPRGDLVDQAAVAAEVMRHYCGSDDDCYLVAGHSYGGGVAEQILLDYPQLADKGIFVAGTLSPDHQRSRWYNYIASTWVIKWLLPKEVRASNYEMMRLAESLQLNNGRHDEIHQPILFIQGTEDILVPYETVEYYKAQKKNGVEYMIIDGMDHFIPWTDPELVVEAMME